MFPTLLCVLMKLMCKYKRKISPLICDSSVTRQILHYLATATVTPLIPQRVAIDKPFAIRKMSSRAVLGPQLRMQMKLRTDDNGARLIKLQMEGQKSREDDKRQMNSETNQNERNREDRAHGNFERSGD